MAQQLSSPALAEAPAATYERYFVPAIGAPLARHLVELAALTRGERVLDVACGTGVVARLAAERVGAAAVAGVDINAGMLDVARRTANGASIEWHEASATALPLPDHSFDVVLCQMGLQFIADRAGALRELKRVVVPGGRIVLNVPGPTPPALAVLERGLEEHVGADAARFVTAVFSLHDVEEVRGLLGAAGFAEPEARSDRRTLRLPRPEEFLWQYLGSTPLAPAAAALPPDRRAALERDFAAGAEPFVEAGQLVVEVDVTSATGRG